jgi:hypothetical protein
MYLPRFNPGLINISGVDYPSSAVDFKRRELQGAKSMRHAVYGIVSTSEQASVVVGRLREVGFTRDDISVLLPDKKGTRDFAHEKNTKAPEGAAAGGAAGMGIGAVLGWLAGVGSLAIPGAGGGFKRSGGRGRHGGRGGGFSRSGCSRVRSKTL